MGRESVSKDHTNIKPKFCILFNTTCYQTKENSNGC